MKIKHVMSDGSVRDSIEGLMLPADHPVYKALEKRLRKNTIATRRKRENLRSANWREVK